MESMWRADMRKHGRPKLTRGTLPTPESPGPTCETIRDYPDGYRTIHNPVPPPRKVLAEYRDAIAKWPDCAALHHEFAGQLTFSGKYDEAFAVLETAAALDPTDAGIQSALAGNLLLRGRTEEALGSACRSLAILQAAAVPDILHLSLAHRRLSECRLAAGDPEGARTELVRAIELMTEVVRTRPRAKTLLAKMKKALKALIV